jgi:hypothetical protein
MPTEMLERAVRLYATGMNLASVAAELGVCTKRLARELKAIGVQMRSGCSPHAQMSVDERQLQERLDRECRQKTLAVIARWDRRDALRQARA